MFHKNIGFIVLAWFSRKRKKCNAFFPLFDFRWMEILTKTFGDFNRLGLKRNPSISISTC